MIILSITLFLFFFDFCKVRSTLFFLFCLSFISHFRWEANRFKWGCQCVKCPALLPPRYLFFEILNSQLLFVSSEISSASSAESEASCYSVDSEVCCCGAMFFSTLFRPTFCFPCTSISLFTLTIVLADSFWHVFQSCPQSPVNASALAKQIPDT